MNNSLKKQLDEYVLKYETKEFIKNDPIAFAHRFKEKKDIEIAAFISSILAFGRREMFIAKLEYIFCIMQNKPFDYITNFDKNTDDFQNFCYRFAKEKDIIQILCILKILYTKEHGLLELFGSAYNNSNSTKDMLQIVINYFYSKVEKNSVEGFYFLLPNPQKNSALKRLNMFLRWMVRDGSVDLGLWDFIDKSELIIPLDTHVARLSRKWGILSRSSDDYKSAMEVTSILKKFDPKDPVKYDFALFGFGVNNN